jgi:glycosyltransferase involved in cell wall biosynthesis
MDLLEAAYLARRLEEKRIDHLHNPLGEGSASVAMIAAHLANIPFSLTIHGSSEWDQPMNFALGEKVRRAAFVACVCEYARSQLYRWCDLRDWPKIHLVRCGVTADFLDAPPVPVPAERRLVFVGRLVEVKGLPILIEATRRLAAEGLEFELVLVGDGPLRSMIEEQAARHGLRRHLRITGYQPPAGVRAELLAARAMLMTSFAEGLPVVMMESLALRRPVIGPDVAGIPELIEPGVNGWLVPPGSVEKLADAMRQALTAPPDALDRMGQAGHERVARWHNQTTEARRLEALLAS